MRELATFLTFAAGIIVGAVMATQPQWAGSVFLFLGWCVCVVILWVSRDAERMSGHR